MPSPKEKNMPDIDWRCSNCGNVLGRLDPKMTQLRIKYKDLYITFEGGKVTCLCRRCAAVNTLTDPHYQDFLEKRAAEATDEVDK